MDIPYLAEQVKRYAASIRRDGFPDCHDVDEGGTHQGWIVKDDHHKGHGL